MKCTGNHEMMLRIGQEVMDYYPLVQDQGRGAEGNGLHSDRGAGALASVWSLVMGRVFRKLWTVILVSNGGYHPVFWIVSD